MELNEYQKQAMTTALPTAKNLTYMVLGLASEAGETSGKLKKALRDEWSEERLREEIASEAVDCLWYVSGVLDVLGISLEEAAQANLDKLKSRQERGQIQGSGDNR